MRADRDGKPMKYFEIKHENLPISAVAPLLIARTMLSEHGSLRYSKIKWTYTQQNIGGGRPGQHGQWVAPGSKIATLGARPQFAAPCPHPCAGVPFDADTYR
jgi:type VI secretion system secreted protein Hcp